MVQELQGLEKCQFASTFDCEMSMLNWSDLNTIRCRSLAAPDQLDVAKVT